MYPENYRYTKKHEWVLHTDEGAVVGITHHAQDQLGEIVYVELPDIGAELAVEEEFGSLESVKAVAEVFMPVSGEILEVNEMLEEHPDMVNQNPHESGWLIKVKMTDEKELEGLMDATAYADYVEQESK